MIAGAVIGLIYFALRQPDLAQRYKIIAFLSLCILSIGFWSLYMLEPSLLTVFIANNVNRHVLGLSIPASSYYSLDSIFVIVLGLLYSGLWRYLAKRNKEPSIPAKFILSLLSMGIGYCIFVLGIYMTHANPPLVNSAWIVLGYAFLVTGELLIAPVGLAMVGILLPKGKEGIGMGIWELFTGFAAVLSAYLANLAVIPSGGSPVITNPVFLEAFLKIGLGAMMLGMLALCFIPKLNKHTK
jgi:POT family proton-dependent oligopeptide transporter